MGMDTISYETESWVSSTSSIEEEDGKLQQQRHWPFFNYANNNSTGKNKRKNNNTMQKKKNQVLLEGYVESSDDDDLMRTKSLTDEDLDELKGCVDLGFGGFSYDEIPELCNTLPALELCYSMTHKFIDDNNSNKSQDSSLSTPVASWRISGPGDHPEDVKARLKFWAQTVACTVKLCS